MSQSINLDNVGAVNFNGSTVDQINLNGASIWTGSVSVDIWGTSNIWTAEKAIAQSGVGLFGPVVNINDSSNYIVDVWTSTSYPTPSSQNPYYKGNRIITAMHKTSGATGEVGTATQTPFFGTGAMHICIEGIHPKNFFSSVSVNGRLYNTSDTSLYTTINNLPHGHGTYGRRTFTEWKWEPRDEGVGYSLFSKNTNNVLEFR